MDNYFELFFSTPVLISGLVSFSGAISTIYMQGSITPFSALFFGGSSFVLNFLLFYPDIRDLELSSFLIDFNFIFFCKALISALSGLLSGIIVFNSALEVFGVMLFNLAPSAAVANPPLLLIILATVLASSSFIANTALYINSLSLGNLAIIDRVLSDIQNILDGICDFDINKVFSGFFKLIVDTMASVLSLILGLSIYLLSWGLFKTQVSKAAADFFKITNSIQLNIISYLVAIGQTLNGYFYIDKIFTMMNKVVEGIFGELVLSSNNEEENLSFVQKSLLSMMFIFSCSNALASGKSFMNDPEGISLLNKMSLNSLSKFSLEAYSFSLGAICSFVANFEKSSQAVVEPEKYFSPKVK